MSLFTQFFYPLSSLILFVGEEHQQRRLIQFFICYPLSSCLSSSFSLLVLLFQLVCWWRTPTKARRRLNFFIRYPISSCLLVKNTNKGEEYVMSSFIQFFYPLSYFILFILLFQLACPPLSARLLVKNTNKGENMLCLCSLNFLSVILFNLVCWW